MKLVNLQEMYMNTLRKESVPTTFFLVNGFQLKGIIKAFDLYTVVIDVGGTQEMVFKHAISTLIPEKTIDIAAFANKDDEMLMS